MLRHDTRPAADIPWAQFRFPPFAETALKVLKLVDDEDSSMRRLSDLVSSDPAFSCEVLIIANSALLAQRHAVTSILQAIVLLGVRALKGVCLTVGVRAFLGRSMEYPVLRGIWRHSLASALIAEQLSPPGPEKGTAYTAGVVHEIGRFALSVIRPDEYAALLENHRGSELSLLEAERSLFGFDSREAGLHLMIDWKLPAEFAAILQPREDLSHPNGSWRLENMIQTSCRLADAAGYPAFPGCEPVPYSDLLDAIPIRERCLFHADAGRLSADIHKRIDDIESL